MIAILLIFVGINMLRSIHLISENLKIKLQGENFQKIPIKTTFINLALEKYFYCIIHRTLFFIFFRFNYLCFLFYLTAARKFHRINIIVAVMVKFNNLLTFP